MGMKFEKLKKKNSDHPTNTEKQGRVRGNKNIFKVGLRKVREAILAVALTMYDP